MFIGHYAVGFLGRHNDKMPSLAMMFIAAQLLDLIWPILVLLGIESLTIDPGNTKVTHLDFEHYPYSHSLVASMAWAAILGIAYYLYTKNKKGSFVLATIVVSHWILDFLTHRPDLALSPFGSVKVGLALWNYPLIETILEIGLFIVGVYLYLRSPIVKRKKPLFALIAFLLIIHIMNLLGPPPPSTTAVAWTANLMWLIVLWAWWVEKPLRGFRSQNVSS